MIGHQTVSVMTYVVGVFPLLILILLPTPMLEKVLLVFSIVFTLMGIIWINYLVSANHLQPLINRVNRVNDIVWIRITKDKILDFQVAKKGVYGQTKGMMYRKKADVINKGDFPIQLMNGNKAIMVYDRLSHNVNPDHAIAWKSIYKENDVTTGRDAYKKSRKRIKFRRHPHEQRT